MSIKDLLSLADDKLKETFSKREYDPTKDRARHVKMIEGDERSFGSPEPSRGKKAWKTSNNVVEYTSRMPIEGKTTHYVPAERFESFLAKLKELVTSGAFDKHFEAEAGTTFSGPRARLPRKAREGGSSGWSPERRAKFEETMAARKAAKGQ